jgi:HAD superfamily hydrolase (TIGR01509 family)
VDSATLDRWVEEERLAVMAHLTEALSPDPLVFEPLSRLAARHPVAVVSSSASKRVDACLDATDLARLFPPARRFSAENSLTVPTSKPDPAIYLHALDRLGVPPQGAVAIEDSVPGAVAAVAAGCPTLGNVMFVPPAERRERTEALESAGVDAVISSWKEVELRLARGRPAASVPGR